MPPSDPLVDAFFVESFNNDLETLNSPARVALPATLNQRDVLELVDDEGNFLDFIPSDTSPELAALAYRLHMRGFSAGVRAGEAAAWAKLRYMIGAAADDAHHH